MCYWREKEPGSYSAGTATPCFMALGLPEAPHGIYGLPALEYPGLVKVSRARWWGHRVFPPCLSPLSGCPQVCYHHGSPVDPEDRDRAPPGAPHPDVALLSSFISSYLPGLEPQPAVLETCMYTVRPRCPLCPRPRGQETPPVPSLCPWGAAPSPACSPCDPTEHPRWRLHPGPAPQAQQHRHRGRLLG